MNHVTVSEISKGAETGADERLVTRGGNVVRVVRRGRDTLGPWVQVEYADRTQLRLMPGCLRPLSSSSSEPKR